MPTIARLESAQHIQDVASASWSIVHNLGFTPSITVKVDYEGELREIIPLNIEHVSANEATITFSRPFTGEARLT